MQNERQISLVGLHSTNQYRRVRECACALHLEQKRDHFGTVAIDVHRMFHRDSTALTTTNNPSIRPGLDLRWPPTYAGSTQELARTNPVDPSGPLQMITHTTLLVQQFIIVVCMLNFTGVWFCPPQRGLYSFRAQNKAERLSPVDFGTIAGESQTCILHEGIHTRRNTRDRSITRSLQS